jgi:hypothetical protein
MHRYTKEQIEFIREQAKGKPVDEIQQLFIKEYKVKVTIKSIKGIMYRHGIKNRMQGYSTRFKKGQTSWCKGMKGLDLAGENGRKTQFKTGNLPVSHKPVGSETMKDAIVWIKIAEPNEWRKKHHHIWEQANGPVPVGYVLRFADGNKMNVSLDNLFITPRRVCTSVVKRGIESHDPEINISTHNLAELDLVIKDVKKRIDG